MIPLEEFGKKKMFGFWGRVLDSVVQAQTLSASSLQQIEIKIVIIL